MQDLTISLIQVSIQWENPEANRTRFEKLIQAHDMHSDVFILPEMFTTGFSMNETVVEKHSESSPTVLWMKKLAKEKKAAICGSIILEENGERKNRFVWVDSEQVVTYDKRHLFGYGSEHKFFNSGKDKVIIDYKGWRILPQICYDLRFPVFSRNSWKEDRAEFDLMIYAANWPDARIHAWDALGLARAIENQSYVALVNRVGTDGSELNYVGHSALIDANGTYAISPINESEGVFTEVISYEKLVRFRERFPLLKDADGFSLNS